MASQSQDPPAPQSQINVSSAANRTARVGPYTDAALTRDNVQSVAAASDLPPGSGSTTLGSARPVYANDRAAETANDAAAAENTAVDPPPAAPNSWARGTVNGRRVSRDPYANQGMVGQSFFNNQG